MPRITEWTEREPLDKYELLEVNGRRFPAPFDECTINKIPDLKFRDDDVMICAYMRSGTHWMFEIINMLLTGQVETVPARKEFLQLEQVSQEKLDTFPSPRVLNAHLMFEDLPREVIDRKTKVVCLVRDPRDCLASWYTCIKKIWLSIDPTWHVNFQDWLKLSNNGKCLETFHFAVEWGSWFQNITSLEKSLTEHPDHPIHLVYYEEIIQNPVSEITKLQNFLGVDRNAEFCVRVAEKTEFKKMVRDKEKYTVKFGGQVVHYNKGVVGNWKTMFTVAMSEEFDQLYERKMAGSRFRDRYSRRDVNKKT